ncbi:MULTISPECIES: PAS domain-containing hybrid sensor histidine kinase/response regulator [unclassified Vibrio]|uniref:histidine kinase n=1 Tax=Vibrio sp. HB236076 TaxID=3232307 RepID=A0AB39HAF3_9VIBR|nr:PAS domain-containing hybrid sensor histidine kinase/response regulator [Vibrio sp. HB161653]MDP5255450.1 PAS domain-containing hybrid sensor histidine kinase/response regulator [Vibrio sp. HB161653]
MQGWEVVPISLAYLGVLFLIAWYGDRQKQWLSHYRAVIYALSIAVYCTSWTFYGTVGQASTNPWSFVPIYLGPILVFLFCWPLVSRLVRVSKREHITSIADFIAARYGKSQGLAVMVTLIAVMGILPYIALQLRSITMSLDVLAPALSGQFGYQQSHVAGFGVVVLALFTMLFGTRHIDNTEHHRGMMMAVAFESIVKLLAFLTVGWFVVSTVLSSEVLDFSPWMSDSYQAPNWAQLVIHTLLAMMAFLALPRQFHTMIVENEAPKDLSVARWLIPSYLVLMALFVLPLAWAGHGLLGLGYASDTFVISVPQSLGSQSMAVLAFLGGTSAASGMVIVSTIALAIMVSNDLVMPLLLRKMRFQGGGYRHFSGVMLRIRRALICFILIAAWGCYRLLDSIESLSAIGFLSFAAVTQFAPALLGGLYWRQGNRFGVFAGLSSGFLIWLITVMSQIGMFAGDSQTNVLLWVVEPPLWLAELGLNNSDWGMTLSIVVNISAYVVISLLTRASVTERWQAANFIGSNADGESISLYQARVTVAELETLTRRFVGRARMRTAFEHFWQGFGTTLLPTQQAPASLIRHTERVLAGVFGASSAKLVLNSALQGKKMQLEEVATIVDEASEMYDFSRGLLQGAIEHINQGLSVVDRHLRLVAWNQTYLDMFHYPPGLIQVGRPIEEVIRFNAQRGLCGPGEVERHVQKRISYLKQGSSHVSSRRHPDGREIEVQGNPMPGGGFVMSFTDITVFRQAERALKEANESLEDRVRVRTQELESLNQQLREATERSQRAAESKSRFLAAVSHDLMQPLNAARLFASSLAEVASEAQSQQNAKHIESALSAAEDLIGDLLDISRLEAGKLVVKPAPFPLQSMLAHLHAEFSLLSEQQGGDFHVVDSSCWVYSDAKLLRRIVQNFLTNAFRYNPKGRIVLGVRRQGQSVSLQVWDDGPGIEKSKQEQIFEEFTRGSQVTDRQGLGLGLTIAKGIADVLGHRLSLESQVGKGSAFSILLPRVESVAGALEPSDEPANTSSLQGLKVLCIDDQAAILEGMQTLLSRWQCEVNVALNGEQMDRQLSTGWQPKVILSDYRLQGKETGLDLLKAYRQHTRHAFVGVIISADRTPDIVEQVKEAGFIFLAKPVKPLKLRALLNQSVE